MITTNPTRVGLGNEDLHEYETQRRAWRRNVTAATPQQSEGNGKATLKVDAAELRRHQQEQARKARLGF
jgi:hypothetical protein